WGQALFGYAEAHQFDIQDYLLAGTSLVVAFIALLRLFSVLLALLQYFGFRLEEHGRRLTVVRGLLTRLRSSVPRRRIQAWTLEESLTHRLLRRRSLHVDTAVGAQPGQSGRGLRDLAPIATAQQCDALVRHLLPQLAWPPAHWQPLHPRAWLRLALPGVLLALVVAAALCWNFGAWGLLALAWLPWSVFVARRHAAHAAAPGGGRGTAASPNWTSCRRCSCGSRRWTGCWAWPRWGSTPPARARCRRRCGCTTCPRPTRAPCSNGWVRRWRGGSCAGERRDGHAAGQRRGDRTRRRRPHRPLRGEPGRAVPRGDRARFRFARRHRG